MRGVGGLWSGVKRELNTPGRQRARRDPVILGLLLILAACGLPGLVSFHVLLVVSGLVAAGIIWRSLALRRAMRDS